MILALQTCPGGLGRGAGAARSRGDASPTPGLAAPAPHHAARGGLPDALAMSHVSWYYVEMATNFCVYLHHSVTPDPSQHCLQQRLGRRGLRRGFALHPPHRPYSSAYRDLCVWACPRGIWQTCGERWIMGGRRWWLTADRRGEKEERTPGWQRVERWPVCINPLQLRCLCYAGRKRKKKQCQQKTQASQFQYSAPNNLESFTLQILLSHSGYTHRPTDLLWQLNHLGFVLLSWHQRCPHTKYLSVAIAAVSNATTTAFQWQQQRAGGASAPPHTSPGGPGAGTRELQIKLGDSSAQTFPAPLRAKPDMG